MEYRELFIELNERQQYKRNLVLIVFLFLCIIVLNKEIKMEIYELILKLIKTDNWQISKLYLESIPEIEQQLNNEKK